MFALSSAGLLALAGMTPLQAADLTWTGGGDGVSWSSGGNWDANATPVAGDTLFFGGSVGTANNNDLAANTVFNGLTFNSDAATFYMSGNAIYLGGGFTNNSTNPQTIDFSLDNHGADRTYDAAAGDLIFTAGVSHNRMIKEGTNTIWLEGTIDNNSLGATVNAGMLVLDKSPGGNRAIGSTLTINTGGTVELAPDAATDQIHYNQRVFVNEGGTLDVENFEEIAILDDNDGVGGLVKNDNTAAAQTLQVGGGKNHRGIFDGTLQDGAGVLNFEIHRDGHVQVFNGHNTYSGTTTVDDNRTDGDFGSTLIVNGSHIGGGAYIFSSTTAHNSFLGGTGVLSVASVEIGNGATLSPGGALSADSDSGVIVQTTGILTFSNLVSLDGNSSTLELQLNGADPGSGYDQVAIEGSGVFSNNNANLVLTLGYTPAVGDKFTIVKVNGTDPSSNMGVFTSLDGVPTDLSQGAVFVDTATGQAFQISYQAEGTNFDAGAGNGNDIMLEALAPVGGAELTWRGNGTDNNWDAQTTADWWNGSSLTTFSNTDFVTFNDTGDNTIPLNLVGDLSPVSVLVDATKDYVFAGSGRLAGTVILTKTNTGTLSIVTDNINLGSALIKQGMLQAGTNGMTGTLSGSVNISSDGVYAINRSDDVTLNTAAFSGDGGFLHNGSGQLTITAAIPFTGMTTNTGGLLQFGDGNGTSGSIGGDIHVGAGQTIRYYFSGDADVANSVSGSGTVNYENAIGNTITVGGTAVSGDFNGTLNVVGYTRIHASDGNAGYALGNGSTMNVPDGTQVWIDRSATTYPVTFNIAGTGWQGDTPQLGALRLFGCTLNGPAINLLADSRIGGTISGATILSPITGDYQLEILGNAGSYVLNLGPTNGLDTYASTLITSGTVRALNSNAISSGPLTMDIAGDLRLNGNDLTVANLSSTYSGLVTGTGATIQNTSDTTPATLTVGTDNSSTTFDGAFLDGGSAPLGLTKAGTGTFTLTGATSNTGPVSVTGGTLALTGTATFGSASVFAVGSGATLDVSGIGGTLTLNANQTLKHSGASTGPITVSGNVDIANGTLLLGVNRDGLAHDSLAASGSTTYSGTLAVTNIGAALQKDDSFQLFPSGVSGFTAYNLQTNDVVNNVKYTWNNTVSSDGKVTVASVSTLVNTTPTNLVVNVSDNTIHLSWPADHLGWILETNSVGLSAVDAWFPYPGSASMTNVDIPIDGTQSNVYFRMTY